MEILQILLIVCVSGVVFVNGWTDAPNAITGIVSTKTLSYGRSAAFAACLNMLGLLVISAYNSSVAETIVSLTDFGAYSAAEALAALTAAMAAIIVFAAGAWFFGIPSSESHALIAGLGGAFLALNGKIYPDAWIKVIIGLLMSVVLSFAAGVTAFKALRAPLKRVSGRGLDIMQLIAAGGTAFMHGAQDGQKFTAVFVAASLVLKDGETNGSINLKEHMLAMVFCGALMAAGTSIGGKRIIDNIGGKMVSLKKPQSIAADAASGLCLLLASMTGIPMSTTHTKTAAIMGACFKDKKTSVNYKIIGEVILTWIITFPVCCVLGWFFTKMLLILV